ncbi:MAG: hypothetical protein KDJ36_12860 [Hyphomicrobiaceae bacterium]|nr:hypothetical protein [Hyphomicrobiaceae bacterium]
MGILRTLFKVLIGFVLACLTAALVQVLYVSPPTQLASAPSNELASLAEHTLTLVLSVATHFALFSLAFALIAAGIAEWLGVRSLGYWLTIGVGIALLGFFAQYSSEVAGQPTILNNYALQSFMTAGFFGGFVYWLIAGKRAGARYPQDHIPTTRPRILVEQEKETKDYKKGSLAERIALKRAQDAKAKADAKAAAIPPPPAPEPRAGATTSVPVTKPAVSAKPQPPPAAETSKRRTDAASVPGQTADHGPQTDLGEGPTGEDHTGSGGTHPAKA